MNSSKKCNHGTFLIKSNCRFCNDPMNIVSNNMLIACLKNNKHYETDEEDVVTKQHFCDLLKGSSKCFYCEKQMQFFSNAHDYASVGRLCRSEGYTKDNCVIVCMGCSSSRKVGVSSHLIPLSDIPLSKICKCGFAGPPVNFSPGCPKCGYIDITEKVYTMDKYFKKSKINSIMLARKRAMENGAKQVLKLNK